MVVSRLRLLVALLFASLVLLGAPLASAQMKIAVIDLRRAVMETEDGLRAQATLKRLFDRRQLELDARQEELKRARDEIDKQTSSLSREALERKRAELEQGMAELQGMFAEFNREIQKEESRITQPILNRVQSVLRQLASQDGYDAIIDRAAVPYARSDLDITDRVIQRYNAGAGGADVASPTRTPAAPAAPTTSTTPTTPTTTPTTSTTTRAAATPAAPRAPTAPAPAGSR